MSPQQPPPGRRLPPQQPPPGAPMPPQPGPYPPHYPGQHYPPPGYPPPHPGYPRPSAETRRDAAAAWSARLELGPTFEMEIAEGLADQVERLAAERMAIAESDAQRQAKADEIERGNRNRQLALGIVSAGVGIPITAIALHSDPGLSALVVSWAGLVGLNAIHAVSLIRRRRR